MHSMDTSYSLVKKFEQPIERIDIDAPTLGKQQTYSVTFIEIFVSMHVACKYTCMYL